MSKRKISGSAVKSKRTKIKQEEECLEGSGATYVEKVEEEVSFEEPSSTCASSSSTSSSSSGQEISNNNKSRQKNKKKLFWSVEMKSLKFASKINGREDSALFQMVENDGEDTSQYCCLGLFVQVDTISKQASLVLNKRFKNVIATFGDVKEVNLFEIINNPKFEGKQVEKYQTKPHSKNEYYASMKGLSAVNQNRTKLAWKVTYEDDSFDIHVMKEEAVKTVQNNTANLLSDFASYYSESVKFFDRNDLKGPKRPSKLANDQQESGSNSSTETSQTTPVQPVFAPPPFDAVLLAKTIIDRSSVEEQFELFMYTWKQVQSSFSVPQYFSMMSNAMSYSVSQPPGFQTQTVSQPQVQTQTQEVVQQTVSQHPLFQTQTVPQPEFQTQFQTQSQDSSSLDIWKDEQDDVLTQPDYNYSSLFDTDDTVEMLLNH